MKWRVSTIVMLGIALIPAVSSAKQFGPAHPHIDGKYSVDVGVYFPEREFKVAVNGQVPDVDREIDFEQNLGISSSDETMAINFGWRFRDNWLLSTQYFSSDNTSTAILSEDVEWADDVFIQGSSVLAGQEFSIIRAFVAYEFRNDGNQVFGIGGGLHRLEIGASIAGDIITPTGNVTGVRAVDADGILPNIGAWYIYSLTERLALSARLDWIGASIDEYDGRLVNASVGANYQFFEHFGVGLSYNHLELDFGITKSDWRGTATTTYEGAFIHLSAYW